MKLERIYLIIAILALLLAIPLSLVLRQRSHLLDFERRQNDTLQIELKTKQEQLQQREAEKLEIQDKLEKENKQLETKLQSKLKKEQELAQVPVIAQDVVASQSFGGTCDSWIADAGIIDVANANELIDRESECDPHAYNDTSGACGVAQELPCGKSGCARLDGGCQVKWMNAYIMERYGSWAAAVAHHDAVNWY